MDARRFDTFTRALTAISSRRGVARGLAGLTLAGALVTRLRPDETEARKKKKRGKHKHDKQRTSPPPAATCTDGLKNGSESDVDCGGACPRCGNGKICATRSDCVGGLCAGGTCQACAVDDDCGDDADDKCYCAEPATGGSKVCTKADQTGGLVSSCTLCPIDTFCFEYAASGRFWCFKPCGAAY